jgi:aminopeptidase-like protein
MSLPDGTYDVCIDTTLRDGFLNYGEFHLPGKTEDEILISCHICHPSLCNDNLSGIAVATYLARLLCGAERRHSYRFLFVPGTIGAITWLARNEARTKRIRHGLVLTSVGDRAELTYKRSRHGDMLVDRAFAHLLSMRNAPERVLDFSPYGYDERQYCSPGFDLPVGCLMRSVHGTFPEYHTSADDLTFVAPETLADSAAACLEVFDILENDRVFLNQKPKCEPQLGRRGLYKPVGGSGIDNGNLALLWVLNQSDGRHSLLDIAVRSRIPFRVINRAAASLEENGLVVAVE